MLKIGFNLRGCAHAVHQEGRQPARCQAAAGDQVAAALHYTLMLLLPKPRHRPCHDHHTRSSGRCRHSPAVPQHRDEADVGRHVHRAVKVAAAARVFKTKQWV